MTLPDERYRAIEELGNAIRKLNAYTHGKGRCAMVPREEIKALVGWLRHYPTSYDLEQMAQKAPEVVSKPGGPVLFPSFSQRQKAAILRAMDEC